MDRAKVKLLRKVLETALQDIEEKHGVKVNIGNASYSNANCTFKVELADIGENGEALTKEAQAFKELASMYGLEASDLGREFTLSGKRFKIVGLSPRKSKYPILAARVSDGRSYKFDVKTVKIMLAAA